MPKAKVVKTKAYKPNKQDSDFFFLVSVSVFAALTIFAASYLAQTKREAQARRNANKPLPVSQLDLASPKPPQYHNIAPRKAK